MSAETVRLWGSDELYAWLAKVEPVPLRKQVIIDKFRQAEVSGRVFLTATEKWFSEQCGLPAGVAKELSMISASLNSNVSQRKRKRVSGTSDTSEDQKGKRLQTVTELGVINDESRSTMDVVLEELESTYVPFL